MQNRYRIYRRGRGSFYVKDRITGKAESLARQTVPKPNTSVQ